MQGELKTVKEFRKKRGEMEVQLVQLRATLTETERQHQVALQALEQRFFEEKVHVSKKSMSVCITIICM